MRGTNRISAKSDLINLRRGFDRCSININLARDHQLYHIVERERERERERGDRTAGDSADGKYMLFDSVLSVSEDV